MVRSAIPMHNVLGQVDEQVERVDRLWGVKAPPFCFDPESFVLGEELPLLVCPVPTYGLWVRIEDGEGRKKQYWCVDESVDLENEPGAEVCFEPTWLRFIPAYGRGMSATEVCNKRAPVASLQTILSALIHYPHLWGQRWICAGTQVRHNGVWSAVPYIAYLDDGHTLALRTLLRDSAHPDWSVPLATRW